MDVYKRILCCFLYKVDCSTELYNYIENFCECLGNSDSSLHYFMLYEEEFNRHEDMITYLSGDIRIKNFKMNTHLIKSMQYRDEEYNGN